MSAYFVFIQLLINPIFKVNESLLAMSSEKDKSDTNSDTLNNGDNNISDSVVNSSVHNKGNVHCRVMK